MQHHFVGNKNQIKKIYSFNSSINKIDLSDLQGLKEIKFIDISKGQIFDFSKNNLEKLFLTGNLEGIKMPKVALSKTLEIDTITAVTNSNTSTTMIVDNSYISKLGKTKIVRTVNSSSNLDSLLPLRRIITKIEIK